MPFWTSVDGERQDPKRVSRFKVTVNPLDDPSSSGVWYAKSFTRPEASIKNTPHRYLNHTFYYPGSVEWNEVTLKMVDPTDPIDAAGSLASLLVACGYQIPDSSKDASDLINISKRKSVAALGTIAISQIDDEGNTIEKWTLKQPIVTKIAWGGEWKYEGDDLHELSLSLRYDWATCEIAPSKAIEITTSPDAVGPTGRTFFERS